MSRLIVGKQDVQERCEVHSVAWNGDTLNEAVQGRAEGGLYLSSHIIRGALEGNFSAQHVGLRQQRGRRLHPLFC